MYRLNSNKPYVFELIFSYNSTSVTKDDLGFSFSYLKSTYVWIIFERPALLLCSPFSVIKIYSSTRIWVCREFQLPYDLNVLVAFKIKYEMNSCKHCPETLFQLFRSIINKYTHVIFAFDLSDNRHAVYYSFSSSSTIAGTEHCDMNLLLKFLFVLVLGRSRYDIM